MSVPAVGAYVLCHNNARTVRQAVESVARQTLPIDEIVVVDDASDDHPDEELRGLGVRVVRHDRNLGRGAARARAMEEVRHDYVLCCDASKRLELTFVERALPWFNDERVAAVVGRITQPPARGVVDRWRGRHLLKLDTAQPLRHRAALVTAGALIRASAVGAVGGYDPRLRHTEDADLGVRLLEAGYDIVGDPDLHVECISSNTLGEVLERYWRWYAGANEEAHVGAYWKTIGYSIKSMAVADLRAGDPRGVPISLLCPHYQFWRSWQRRRRRRY